MTRPRGPADEPVVHPTHDDPIVEALSEGVGGPMGDHAAGHPWLRPASVLLLLTAVCLALGMVQKTGCYQSEWRDTQLRYAQMCYSDLPYLYTGRGMAEHQWPFTDDPGVRARYEVMEYPVGIAYWAWGTAWVTQWVAGSTDVSARADLPRDSLWGDPGVRDEIVLYVVVNAVGFAVLALLTTWLLAGVHPRRPWDAAGFALAPALALTALINWDLVALVFVAGALWAFARDRPVLTGVLIGLGTAAKLYPLFLLGGILVICWRRRRLVDLGLASVSAAIAWVLANAPAYLTGPEAWRHFWRFNADRGADLGSVWLLVEQVRRIDVPVSTINAVSWGFFVAWCAGVLALGLAAPRTPRLAQLGFLIVVGFLLVNKVYSPQYVLWLLPLAVLARPQWRDLLIWQATEALYFASVWWYLGGYLDSRVSGEAGFYWIAIVVRVVGELYLVGVVVRDVLRPHHDPVPTTDTPPTLTPV